MRPGSRDRDSFVGAGFRLTTPPGFNPNLPLLRNQSGVVGERGRLGRSAEQIGTWKPAPTTSSALCLVVLISLLISGCATGTYPIDIFSEMHNQPSQRYLEPERRAAPRGAVPVSGTRARLTFEQAADQPNPLPQTPETLARAVELYRVNCTTCHGADGRGNGPMAPYFRENPAAPVPPVDLSSPRVQQRTDGQLHWLLANGIGNMPAYGSLLADQDLWALVTYVRTVR
jgi:mono/diheme cytochrome c family protein